MLVGFVLLGQAAGTYRLSAIAGDAAVGPDGRPWPSCSCWSARSPSRRSTRSTPGCPGAMVAPTPVSAYLHSATMVKAGVYLVGAASPRRSPPWQLVAPTGAVTVGLVTMVAGGLRALRQHDLKLLLAYGTVSQLGFMFVVCSGPARPRPPRPAALLLLAHALFKAALFMVVGIIDHETGTRDLRALPRPRPPVAARSWPIGVVSAASMAGVPLASASSPRRRPTRPSPTAGSAVRGAGARRACGRLGAHRRLQPPLRVGRVHRRGHRLGRNAPPAVDRPRPAARRSWRPPPCWPPCTVVLGVVPSPRRRPRRRRHRGARSAGRVAVAPRRVARLQPAARPVGPHPRRRRAAVRGPPAGRPACWRRGRRIPSGADVYLAGAAGPERGRPTGSPASCRAARCRSTRA